LACLYRIYHNFFPRSSNGRAYDDIYYTNVVLAEFTNDVPGSYAELLALMVNFGVDILGCVYENHTYDIRVMDKYLEKLMALYEDCLQARNEIIIKSGKKHDNN
jgi:hypothetical protein